MKILESKFVQGFIKMADDGYKQGWHERNGGNLSYRLKAEEVEMIRPRLNAPGEWTENTSVISSLTRKYVLRSLSLTRQEPITVSAGVL